MIPIRYDSTTVPLSGQQLSELWWQGRQWAVTAYGLEQRDGTYVIEASRLIDGLRSGPPHSLFQRLAEKGGADMHDFATAFFVACAMHGHHLTTAEIKLLRENLVDALAFLAAERGVGASRS